MDGTTPIASEPKTPSNGKHTAFLDLQLTIEDPQALSLLLQVPDGRPRQQHAQTALRIGLMALEQARGRIDADVVRREGTRLVEEVEEKLATHGKLLHERLGRIVSEYFDPEGGRLPQRLQDLCGEGGELQRVLGQALRGEESHLAQTLARHVGEESALLRKLDPESADGVVNALSETIEERLRAQTEAVRRELSLDVEDSALRRFLNDLEKRHGKLEESVQKRLEQIVDELSLDDDGSALSRLVAQVTKAQRLMTSELTLDNEGSALNRVKRELANLLRRQEESQAKFQEQIKQAVAELNARREAESRSTTHGERFEDLVVAQMRGRAERAGDQFEATGTHPGRLNKKGDAVVELHEEHAAAGARIVIEAKERKRYTLRDARKELEEARDNRDADVGIFVFSARTAPDEQERFQRHGSDLFVVWDADDPHTDVVLDAALSVARALSVAARTEDDGLAGVAEIEDAVVQIAKRVENLGQIQTWARTIHTSAGKILERVRIDREALQEHLEALRSAVESLKAGEEGTG